MDQIIIKLANIIAAHDREEIQKELRIIALTKKNAENTPEEKKILRFADQFIQKNGERDDNWGKSSHCFSELSRWFLECTEIENHQLMAIVAWKCHIQHILSNTIFSKDIIILGNAFYAEPHQFLGFLYWLLTVGATPENIYESKILHDFFAYQVINLSEIQSAYALLAKLNSQSIADFLIFLQNKPCEMRGFCNNPSEDKGNFSSYNLLGEMFTHEILFSETKRQEKPLREMDSNIIGKAPSLFQLFEWHIIKKLNFNSQTHAHFLSILLKSPFKNKMLDEFPNYVLSGVLPKELAQFIFSQIQLNLIGCEMEELIYQEPFYIHAINVELDPNLISDGIIDSLCSESKYKTLPHLFYLANLVYALTSFKKESAAKIEKILGAIFEPLLQYGNLIPDDAIKSIYPVIHQIYPFADKKIDFFYEQVKNGIADFIHEIIDYDSLAHIWGNQLSACNLLLQLYPELQQKNYPATIYQLHAQILQWCHQTKKQAFSMWDLLSKMTADVSMQNRILQETIIHPLSTPVLIKTILKQCNTHISPQALCCSPFGHEGSVLYHAISTTDNLLYTTISNYIEPQQHLLAIASQILTGNKFEQMEFLWERIHFDDSTSTTIATLLITQFADTHDPSEELLNFYFEKLHFLLCNKKAILTENNIQFIFKNAIKYNELKLLYALCANNSINKPNPSTISQAIEACSSNDFSLELIGFLFGLSGADNIDPAIIKPNQIQSFLQFRLELHSQIQSPFLLTYRNTKNETLLQIMANCSSFNDFRLHLQTIEQILCFDGAIQDFLNKKTISGDLVSCTNDQNPDQKKINDHLDELRQKYKELNDTKLNEDYTSVITPRQQRHLSPTFLPQRRSRSPETGNNTPYRETL